MDRTEKLVRSLVRRRLAEAGRKKKETTAASFMQEVRDHRADIEDIAHRMWDAGLGDIARLTEAAADALDTVLQTIRSGEGGVPDALSEPSKKVEALDVDGRRLDEDIGDDMRWSMLVEGVAAIRETNDGFEEDE